MNELGLFIEKIREQRHDFMNYIQVIYGYLQLDKTEEAIRYINKIIDINQSVSKVYLLGDECLGFILGEKIRYIQNKNIKVELCVEIEQFSKKILEIEYDKKANLVNNIFDKLENNKLKFVYVYIFEDILGESILISNTSSVVTELDWMEDWIQEDIDLDNVKLHKYISDKEEAYRITFL